ncbi:hypothetical protein [Candidatus Enterococcus clewellii]|uniref:DUF7832 domain-containing protein n=1 Tax=Candidatus Enterococcus clewellii TaxID=1834193 RepID=A0A242K1Z3_9ENTE|nr:hypothetical protein [Enterococcus sp. 9E7_DIV0242]OTP11583.1 hypothetical protein A5888_003682 [Enterococcus sp. 9E7_DIV0242]
MAYDKAKWHFEAEDFPKGIEIEQGGVHMAFFYRWMLEKDFAGEDLLDEMIEEVQGVKSGSYSALDLLFEFNDGVLLAEDFSETGVMFADQYYEEGSGFAQRYGSYLTDYGMLTLKHKDGVEDSDYGILYSDDNYQKVKAIIDQRYQEFLVFTDR